MHVRYERSGMIDKTRVYSQYFLNWKTGTLSLRMSSVNKNNFSSVTGYLKSYTTRKTEAQINNSKDD